MSSESTQDRRSLKRQPVNIDIEFTCHEKICSGTIKNISLKGMLIRTKDVCFPIQSDFDISIPHENEILRVPARLKRMEMPPDLPDEIGVIILNPSQAYFDFVSSLNHLT